MKSLKTVFRTLPEASDLDIDEDFSLDFEASDLGFDEEDAVAELESESEIEIDSELETAELESAAQAESVTDLDMGELEDISLDLDADIDLPEDLEAGLSALDTDDLGDSLSMDDDSDEFDISALSDDVDEVTTKLDLAKAYIDMGDSEGARSILEEVKLEGNDDQKQQADELLSKAS